MNGFLRFSCVVFLASGLSLFAATESGLNSAEDPKGVWHSVVGGVKKVVSGAASVAKTATGTVGKAFDFTGPKRSPLRLNLVCASNPVRLGAGRSLGVKVQLLNSGKKVHLLEFANGQRVEVVVRDASGKIVGRSAGSAGEEGGMVTINPGERIEFVLDISTKELVAGKSYSLEAAITGQAGLVAKTALGVAP